MERVSASQPESFGVEIVNPYTPENLARMSIERNVNLENSHRTDAYARSMGYKAATVGGNIIKGYVVMGILKAWGLDWLQRGGYYLRYRRPLYGGDQVAVTYTPVREEEGASRVDWQATNGDGEVCALGWASLPHVTPAAPALVDFPFTPPLKTLLRYSDGEKLIGQALPSNEVDIPGSVVAKLRTGQFGENEGRIQDPLYEDVLLTLHVALGKIYPELIEKALLGPWTINAAGPQAAVMAFDERRPGGGLAADIEEQFFSLASVHDRLTVHRRISDLFERKGSRFLEAETLIVANQTTPVVLRRAKSVIQHASERDR